MIAVKSTRQLFPKSFNGLLPGRSSARERRGGPKSWNAMLPYTLARHTASDIYAPPIRINCATRHRKYGARDIGARYYDANELVGPMESARNSRGRDSRAWRCRGPRTRHVNFSGPRAFPPCSDGLRKSPFIYCLLFICIFSRERLNYFCPR